jgi:hypothetical protein
MPFPDDWTPAQISLANKAAINKRWSRLTAAERTEATAPGRAGWRKKFADEIDPGRELPEAELEARVDQAVKAFMQSIALKASRKRAKKAAGE